MSDISFANEQQQEEIAALEAIWPDSVQYHILPDKACSLSLPVHLDLPNFLQKFTVHEEINGSKQSSVVHLNHLPPLTVTFMLSKDYPEQAPSINIDSVYSLSSTPEWINNLVQTSKEHWVQGEQSVYFIIDHVQTTLTHHHAHEDSIHLYSNANSSINVYYSSANPVNSISPTLSSRLENYNRYMIKSEFDADSFSCGICLEDKKGQGCVELENCQHVFCIPCLKSYFSFAIQQGHVNQVHCPEPTCVRARSKFTKTHQIPNYSNISRPGDISLNQLTDILGNNSKYDGNIQGNELLTRYKRLLEKQRQENEPGLAYCPRLDCQAPVSQPKEATNSESRYSGLRTCPDCGYSFCHFCRKTWHGPTNACSIEQSSKVVKEYLDGDEAKKRQMEFQYGKANINRIVNSYNEHLANEKWKSDNTQTCPGCQVSIEKSQGCNHMLCWKCKTHFCFRCSSKLDAEDPYAHFNNPMITRCFHKLFDYQVNEEEELLIRFPQL